MKLIIKGILDRFDTENRNPPSYRTRAFWKNIIRKSKIKKILNIEK